jgi:CubicO group peptidase (beta-lactamase class C family)
VGLSAERLARIDAHLKSRYVDPGKIAGALSLVWRGGQIAWLSPVGLSDRERGRPMAPDAIFRIYSMTKPVTSVALMMLYEEGRFRLDDAVSKYIPAWRDLRVYEAGNHPHFVTRPCARPMTVRDLLTHTSGLTYGFMQRTNLDAAYRKVGIGAWARHFPGTLEEMVAALADLPLEFSPGAAWNYSVSTDVVGRLVEILSGERLDTYLHRNLFAPLGMMDTSFHVPEEKRERLAACYERGPRKALRLQDDPAKSRYVREEPPRFLSGGGGLVSTAADYLRFCRMLLGGGEVEGARILGPRTIDLMVQNHLPGRGDLSGLSSGAFSETTYEGTGFGLGFSVLADPVAAGTPARAGTYAWGGAASTIFWIDPAEELVVIFLTQLMPSGTFNFRGQLEQIVYGAIVD